MSALPQRLPEQVQTVLLILVIASIAPIAQAVPSFAFSQLLQPQLTAEEQIALALDTDICGGEHHEMSGYGSTPMVDLALSGNRVDGYVAEFHTKHFEWVYDADNPIAVLGQGHAHVFIDGELITSAQEDTLALPELEAGLYEIEVALVANDHRTYAFNSRLVTDRQFLRVE